MSKFKEKIVNRIYEPSSWASLSAITLGLGQLVKADNIEVVANAIDGVGQAVASGSNPYMAFATVAFGLLGFFMKEKQNK